MGDDVAAVLHEGHLARLGWHDNLHADPFPVSQCGNCQTYAALAAPLLATARAQGAEQALRPFRDLFDGGPDTACRTVWVEGLLGTKIECVEVPMLDLREAFARADRLAADHTPPATP